jgi:hypothetical protein
VGAREKHTVNLVAIRTVQVYVHAFECLSEDSFSLIMPTKYYFIDVEATAFFDAWPNQPVQLIIQTFEQFNILFVPFIARNGRSNLALKESSDSRSFGLLIRLNVHLVVVGPKRKELSTWKPHVLEADLDFNSFQCFFDLAEGFSDINKYGALLSFLANLLVDLCVEID